MRLAIIKLNEITINAGLQNFTCVAEKYMYMRSKASAIKVYTLLA